MAGRDKETPEGATDWKPKFLEALAETGTVRGACLAAEIGRATAYRHRDSDEAFAADWDAALETAADALEQEARRRAVKGTLKPVYHQGTRCGAIRQYSDTLLIFLLKGMRPEKYRDNYDLRKLLASLPESAPLASTGD